MTATDPVQIPASYVDDGKPCVVIARTLATRQPRRTFAVGSRPLFLLSPNHLEDRGRIIRADQPGPFGGF